MHVRLDRKWDETSIGLPHRCRPRNRKGSNSSLLCSGSLRSPAYSSSTAARIEARASTLGFGSSAWISQPENEIDALGTMEATYLFMSTPSHWLSTVPPKRRSFDPLGTSAASLTGKHPTMTQ